MDDGDRLISYELDRTAIEGARRHLGTQRVVAAKCPVGRLEFIQNRPLRDAGILGSLDPCHAGCSFPTMLWCATSPKEGLGRRLRRA